MVATVAAVASMVGAWAVAFTVAALPDVAVALVTGTVEA
jgi:hypothetical protein